MIEIREIHSKKDIKTFVDFPTKLYKGVAEYSYPLRMDELNMFNPKKNLAYKDCEVALFKREKERLDDFVRLCENPSESYKLVDKINEYYQLNFIGGHDYGI